jgi:hypothetical protein
MIALFFLFFLLISLDVPSFLPALFTRDEDDCGTTIGKSGQLVLNLSFWVLGIVLLDNQVPFKEEQQ